MITNHKVQEDGKKSKRVGRNRHKALHSIYVGYKVKRFSVNDQWWAKELDSCLMKVPTSRCVHHINIDYRAPITQHYEYCILIVFIT